MVNIPAVLLLTGLTLVSSVQLKSDFKMSEEDYYRMSALRPLAVEFTEYFANISEIDFQSNTSQLAGPADLQCLAEMDHLMKGFAARNMWALKMFDSWGTFPKGILYGNMIDMGNFDECIGNKKYINDNITIRGRYCFAQPLSSSRIKIRIGICFPSSCSAMHMDMFLKQLLQNILGFNDTQPVVRQENCRVPGNQLQDGIFIFTIVLLSALVGSAFLATIYHYLYCQHLAPLPGLVKIFSVRVHSGTLFRLTEPRSYPNVIDCLHGIRCMSLIWVIFGHQYLFALMAPNMNQFRLKWWFGKPFTSFVLRAPFSVDTFLFLSGLLLTTIGLRSMDKTKGKINILLMYLHRYLRLTPVIALAILVYMEILPLLGDGPMFDSVKFDDYNHCKQTWYWTLLYLQNYATPDLCINHGWYLAVDMQLYLLSPIFLYVLYRWGKRAAAGIFVLLLLLSACLFSTMMTKKYPIHLEIGITPDEAQQKLYYATHTHAAPWLIGMLFGYFLHVNRGKSIKLNSISIWLGWILCLAVMFISIFCLLPYANWLKPTLPIINQAFFYTFTRIAWPLTTCWVVFACMQGYGGLANSFLSSSLWQPLSKLSYSAYIFHIFIQQINGRRMRTSTFFSDYDVMLSFWAGFGFVLLLSYVVYIIIEAPFGVLESMLMPNRRPQPKPDKPETLEETNKSQILE